MNRFQVNDSFILYTAFSLLRDSYKCPFFRNTRCSQDKQRKKKKKNENTVI